VWPPLLAGRHVTYAFEGSAVPQVFLPQLIGYWQAGVFPFDRLVRTYPLSEINDAEADSVAGATIKPVLLPTS
jgi:aryl-alcohol dehydrogenase